MTPHSTRYTKIANSAQLADVYAHRWLFALRPALLWWLLQKTTGFKK